jgi:ribonuclease-3
MTTARRRRLVALLRSAGAAGVDPALIEPAFVHESASREGAGPSNERLEFFGDAILGFLAARWLVDRYPDANEGELTRRKAALVSGEACAQTARRLGFSHLLRLGVGTQQDGGAHNASILADAFEAFVAALYRHTDLERTVQFLEREHFAQIDRAEAADSDAKSALQEFTQARFALIPLYLERAEGPAHDRRFTSQVRIGDEVLGEGIGPSKKAAQQSAAAVALAQLRVRHPDPPAPPPPSPPNPNGRVIALRRRGASPKASD